MSESNTQAAVGAGNVWSSMRIGIAYQEARAVLNAQQARKQHCDDKALRTAKLVIAVVAGAISLIKISNTVIQPHIAISAGALLVASFGAALASYATKSVNLGPSKKELDRLTFNRYPNGPPDDSQKPEPWEHGLGAIMGEWISYNEKVLASAKRRLLASQVALFLGLTGIMIGLVF